jgi:hypothetical protein
VHEAILVHADVDKGTECRDVGHDTFELHAFLQVADRLDALYECRCLELRSRVAARLLKLSEDVGDGRDAKRVVDERFGLQRACR